jgi:hypothetical protein
LLNDAADIFRAFFISITAPHVGAGLFLDG